MRAFSNCYRQFLGRMGRVVFNRLDFINVTLLLSPSVVLIFTTLLPLYNNIYHI